MNIGIDANDQYQLSSLKLLAYEVFSFAKESVAAGAATPSPPTTTQPTTHLRAAAAVPRDLPLVRQDNSKLQMLLLALVHLCSCSRMRVSS